MAGVCTGGEGGLGGRPHPLRGGRHLSPALLGVWRITEAGTPPRPLRRDEIVDDVEELVRGVIARTPVTRDLSDADWQELFSALLERVVVLQRNYDPSRDDPRQRRALAFRPWLYQRLRLAAIDELRSWLGRKGQKRSSTNDSSSLVSETAVSMTEILEWIDVSRLPLRTRLTLEAIGSSLTAGLNHAETGRKIGRSEDWVTSRVREVRKALAEYVLELSADEIPPELRARLEQYVSNPATER